MQKECAAQGSLLSEFLAPKDRPKYGKDAIRTQFSSERFHATSLLKIGVKRW
jgi:hypothetical protein